MKKKSIISIILFMLILITGYLTFNYYINSKDNNITSSSNIDKEAFAKSWNNSYPDKKDKEDFSIKMNSKITNKNWEKALKNTSIKIKSDEVMYIQEVPIVNIIRFSDTNSAQEFLKINNNNNSKQYYFSNKSNAVLFIGLNTNSLKLPQGKQFVQELKKALNKNNYNFK